MKKIILFVLCLGFSLGFAQPLHVKSAEALAKMTPKQALEKLIEGNKRYVAQDPRQHDQDAVLKKISKGQHPFAFIFNCVDSRSVPELLFDQTLGNIFVGRIAGNVTDRNILGSMEFAVKFSGSKVIVVMGHTACGAVRGACNNVKAGNLTYLLKQIQPAVSTIRKEEGKAFNCDKPQTIDAIAKVNVLNQIKYIMTNSPIIAKLVKENKIMVVGAMHNLANGKIAFFNMDGKTVN